MAAFGRERAGLYPTRRLNAGILRTVAPGYQQLLDQREGDAVPLFSANRL